MDAQGHKPTEPDAAGRARRPSTGRPVAPVPRLGLNLEEAATSLGMSLSHFRRYVLPNVRVARTGSVRTVPVKELDKWLDLQATVAGAPTMRLS